MNNPPGYQREIYLWLSIALYAPLLMLPLRLEYSHGAPAFGVQIEVHWLLLAACLLLVAVVADSLLTIASKPLSANVLAMAGVWIFIVALFVPWLIAHPDDGWLMGLLFMLNGSHSAWLLFRNQAQWWSWIAWLRDAGTAATIFYWLHFWPAY